MNVPNRLTVLRVVLTGVIIVVLFMPGLPPKLWAIALFAAAALSDWLDGYLARRWHQITPLGMLWDPIADKVLVIGLLSVFVRLRILPLWMVLVIAVREVAVTVARAVALRRRVVIAAAKEGKQKAFVQMGTILLALVLIALREASGGEHVQRPLHLAVLVGMVVTTALTVQSGVLFFRRHWSVVVGRSSVEP